VSSASPLSGKDETRKVAGGEKGKACCEMGKLGEKKLLGLKGQSGLRTFQVWASTHQGWTKNHGREGQIEARKEVDERIGRVPGANR